MVDFSQLMTTEEAAAYLQLHASTLVMWRVKKTGPKFIKIGKNVRYTQAHLNEWLQSRVVDPTPKASDKPVIIIQRIKQPGRRMRDLLDEQFPNQYRVPGGRPRKKTGAAMDA
ncbi:hypothetical protein SIID45300_01667 [Candidatus Magnetaquicoccaceae bacterium FCR-1]|uniref:Helix-turn-helix domain-containing protein n=1 Tax=Candidatus Magnetaquiglobus chichijimensis TaxID=3141448 RepID=A0ABQ0C8Y4_9PROT